MRAILIILFLAPMSGFAGEEADLKQILKYARYAPSGEAKAQEEDENSVFQQLELKPGDVIKSVNGQPVDSPAKAMELYNELKADNSDAMRLSIFFV